MKISRNGGFAGVYLSLTTVASHLQHEALRREPNDGKDEFGRSTFNRFYYAAYLEVRTVLGEMRSEWGGIGHSNIPELLRGNIDRDIKRLLQKAKRTDDARLLSSCSLALSAGKELSKLLERAYAARVVADYRPEIKVKFSDIHFELNEVPLSEAKTWPARAKTLVESISVAWEQIDE